MFLKDAAAAAVWIMRRASAHLERVSAFLSRKSETIATALYVVFCLIFAFNGLRGNIERRGYWESASAIERSMVRTVENLFLFGTTGNKAEKRLYLLNVPEHFISKNGMMFYVASHSLMPDLRHRLGESAQRIELIATGRRFELPLENERAIYRALGWKEQLSAREVEKLAEDGHVVLQFSPYEKALVPLGNTR
jgi:hypothetical protein